MPRKGGAAKAYRAMTKKYGKAKGTKVFYAKANKNSRKGKSMHARTQSYYKKGGHQ
jgi:hypothetical protein